MTVKDTTLDAALEWLKDNAAKAAKARADRLYLEEWIPSLRAQLSAKFIAEGDSAAASDIKAKAHEDYQAALKGYQEAVEADEYMRWHRARADAIIEVWRTSSANQRSIAKAV